MKANCNSVLQHAHAISIFAVILLLIDMSNRCRPASQPANGKCAANSCSHQITHILSQNTTSCLTTVYMWNIGWMNNDWPLKNVCRCICQNTHTYTHTRICNVSRLGTIRTSLINISYLVVKFSYFVINFILYSILYSLKWIVSRTIHYHHIYVCVLFPLHRINYIIIFLLLLQIDIYRSVLLLRHTRYMCDVIWPIYYSLLHSYLLFFYSPHLNWLMACNLPSIRIMKCIYIIQYIGVIRG